MIFTFDQAHAYFANRLQEPSLQHRQALTVRCPFHGDRTASMSINLEKGGVWNCHGCHRHGGIFDFEKEMFGLTRGTDELWAEIYKVTGATPRERTGFVQNGRVVATYNYVDPDGRLLFEKRRHDPKSFTQRAKTEDGGWRYNLTGVRKVLYNLPAVMAAQIVLVCEGEKDCDSLNAVLGGSIEVKPGRKLTAVATCNFDGAGKWRDEYAPFFAGRRAVIFPDNDDVGRAHAEQVAKSISRFATSVKIVPLEGLPDKGDVSDFLETNTIETMMAAISVAPKYSESKSSPVAEAFFQHAHEVFADGAPATDWILPGIIHADSKGMIVAQPKAGKSMVALDLAVALATGQSWLGIQPTRRVRVGFLSREDAPVMTIVRLQEFAKARGLHLDSIPDLLINSFRQRRAFSIENDEHVEDLISGARNEGIELLVFDVLNKLTSADENSNTAMTAIMKRFDYIKEATGADLLVIHHDAKNATPGVRRPRGASAIDSWWEWKVSLDVDPDDDSIKHAHFGSKAAQQHAPIRMQIRNDVHNGCDLVTLPNY